jgi:hypothetical protein
MGYNAFPINAKRTRESRIMFFVRVVIVALAVVVSGCAHHRVIPPQKTHHLYVAQGMGNTLLNRYAPVFLIYDYQSQYNRIGRMSARYSEKGREHIYVDTQKPTIYYLQREFSTGKGRYTNLIYRVHFPRVPFSLIPFNLAAGKNVGVLVVITLDDEHRPVLVTTVGTCGCYYSSVPTTDLPREAFPEGWHEEPLKVYGETLPRILDYHKRKNPRLLVYLRPKVHRIMDLEIVGRQEIKSITNLHLINAELMSAERLETIPLDGKFTSLYYQDGALKGHVKGSVKPWETFFLGLVSLDFYVGTDKSYAASNDYENPFYTSLKPWNRQASDMYHFDRFLEFWGWGL